MTRATRTAAHPRLHQVGMRAVRPFKTPRGRFTTNRVARAAIEGAAAGTAFRIVENAAGKRRPTLQPKFYAAHLGGNYIAVHPSPLGGALVGAGISLATASAAYRHHQRKLRRR